MPGRLSRAPALVLLVLLAGLAAGCMTPEQRMIIKVERFMEQERYDQALGYLETYLGRYDKSLAGWRYRVMIRLEQEERALAASEYAALSAALERHEPEVLREVVLGAGGRWLLSDYRALARCAPEGVADVAFFTEVVEPKHLGVGSMSKVAVSVDQIAAVVDALPGQLPPQESWVLVSRFTGDPDPRLASRVVRAAGRHLAGGGLDESQVGEALAVLRDAALSDSAERREAALLASLDLPEGPGRADFAGDLLTALAVARDGERAVSVFLLGPGGEGPGAWSEAQLSAWAETVEGPLRVLAVGGLHALAPTSQRKRFLGEASSSTDAGQRLAAAAGFGNAAGGSVEEAWQSCSVDEQRRWGPAFVRTAAPDRGAWARLAMASSDAVVTQASAAALALPDRGDDAEVDPALSVGMEASDPATRASSARAVVVREASGLSLAVQGVFSQGQDRVMNDVLQGLVDSGNPAWQPLVAQGLAAELPTIRELAVDAAVASCRAEDRELMLGLLDDDDPHVAVRAASALYLLVGSPKKKKKK